MKNDKSYSDLAESSSLKKRKVNAPLQEVFIDMIIHEAILKEKKSKLQKQIDDALDLKDKKGFMKLSHEMNHLLTLFG
ncbi:IDEAL domain-containing protein [Peribacillus psychrosaccharolyticus]|uniref:IDEAL domain-containing protein n=2 Tax=Peribacillus psychrosaccharolyticus TaxID=1407 RepID=A0A974NQX5_PERPY|nr:IDEAL domain-containing protein [Peribacillus psychrosaccharolyticus]MEC2054974.1 IDEAL domain-containing protein [Peribacillus psychrosaccharolyticus]MED3746525.1 IDEAL domain-containing protein [Peribacillus psychrosaccharolyticus]QQT02108.1 IDEAL domain-containing protein [Peribacillus psychrosaccharolyticus]